ncbi:MAG TPA: hypothetical protein VH912_08600 [Streptosporangiaceae bacterium]
MSGYGGQSPSGWQDPYGRQPYGQPYGQDPYRQMPYGQQQPGWQDPYAQQGWQDPYGWGALGVGPQAPASNGAAVGAIICNCVGLVLTCGIGIAWLPGLILGGMAVNRIDSDPATARNLTRGSWICFGLNFVIAVFIGVVVYLANN